MDYFKVLGVKPGASKETVKRAYRRIAMRCHPDRSNDLQAHERFRNATIAYDAIIEGKVPRPVRKTVWPRKKTAKEKYWKVYVPPKDPKEYKEWYRVAQERAAYYSKLKYEKLKKEAEAFRKTNGYWWALVTSSFVSLFTISISLSAIIFPWYGFATLEDPKFFGSRLAMAIVCTIFGVIILFFLGQTYLVKEMMHWYKVRKRK